MNIRIYQINAERDIRRLRFMNMSYLDEKRAQPQAEYYDRVFDGEVDCKNLEDVYDMFNTNIPENFKGHSLSVSDVVEVINDGKSSFHFCDSIGFEEISFKPELAHEVVEKLRVVLVEPGKYAKESFIEKDLKGLQTAVGGYIEFTHPFEDPYICIVGDDEAKLKGKRPNRMLYWNENGEKTPVDYMSGTFIICREKGAELADMTDEDVKHYKEMFLLPEKFFKIDNTIVSIPYEPKRKIQRDER